MKCRNIFNRLGLKKKTESGFSLIEIMVVVVIMGMLIGLIGPGVISRLDEAKIKTAKTQMSTLATALETYYIHNHRYPTTDQGLDALITKPTSSPVPKNWQSGYLSGKRLPLDPWDNSYEYFSPGDEGRPFELYSLGADNREGGEGLDADIDLWD